MTILEIIFMGIIWISYGVFNSYQQDWFKDYYNDFEIAIFMNILIAPIALCIRVFRGIFLWKGKY